MGEISGAKRGHKGPRGNCSAACGEPLGEGGAEASPLFLELVQHALAMHKAWGGGDILKRSAHSAGPVSVYK